jgi:hypothetical protein
MLCYLGMLFCLCFLALPFLLAELLEPFRAHRLPYQCRCSSPLPAELCCSLPSWHLRPGGQHRAEGQDEQRGPAAVVLSSMLLQKGRIRAAAFTEVSVALEEAQRGR